MMVAKKAFATVVVTVAQRDLLKAVPWVTTSVVSRVDQMDEMKVVWKVSMRVETSVDLSVGGKETRRAASLVVQTVGS